MKIDPDNLPTTVHSIIWGVATLFTIAAILALLCSCATVAPDAVRVEVTHISSVSQHLASPPTNYGVDAIPGIELHWQRGSGFMDLSEGYNMQGRNGGSLYGPSEVFIGRIGYEWRIKP